MTEYPLKSNSYFVLILMLYSLVMRNQNFKSIHGVYLAVLLAALTFSFSGCGGGSALGGGGGSPTITPINPINPPGGAGGTPPVGFLLKAVDANSESGAPNAPYISGNNKVSKVAVGGNNDKGSAPSTGGSFKVRGGVSRAF